MVEVFSGGIFIEVFAKPVVTGSECTSILKRFGGRAVR